MKKRKKTYIIAAIVIIFLFIISSSLAIYKKRQGNDGEILLATWDVSLNQTGVNDSLTVVPETYNPTYTLNITSQSQIDIRYTVVISNLPAGVEVSIDNGTFRSPVNNTISFADVGTILYSDNEKTKTHTLTFKANSNATVINNQTVDIDVIVKQIV